MEHPLYRVRSFELLGTHCLRIGFDDGSEQVIDFRPILFGEIFRPLRDPAVFAQVRLDIHNDDLDRLEASLRRCFSR